MLIRGASLWMLCGLGLSSLAPVRGADSDKEKTDVEETRELLVSVRAVESPLMKYRLLPAEYELRDGNAAPILLRLPWEQETYFTSVVPTFSDYLDLPLDDPKVLDSGKVFAPRLYVELKRAAYRRTAEWEYPIGERPIANILLPDVQGARQIIGRGLSVWIRHRIAHGQIEEALEGISLGLANSRHYGRTPFVITQFVCAAVDSMMLARLEELLENPDCPNLYWALTALPRPLIDLRPAVELEQRFLQMSVAGLDELDDLQTEYQWAQKAQEVTRLLAEVGGNAEPKSGLPGSVIQRLAQRARAELPSRIDGGADRVEKMSDAEAGLRWLIHFNVEQSQEIAALMSLEPPAAIPQLAELQEHGVQYRSELGISSLFVLEQPFDAYIFSRKAQRRIDALRVVEAVRNYAATHQGQLPSALDEIADTPIPNDIFTGEPFHYELTEVAALLWGRRYEIDGKEVAAIRYRVNLRK